MKKLMIFGSVAVLFGLTSCDDFLNDNRFPQSSISQTPDFYESEANVQGQTNRFYTDYTGYGNSTSYGAYGMSFLSDDQCGRQSFANWTYTNATASISAFTSPYTEIRGANLIIDGVGKAAFGTTAAGKNYIAMARLHRARQYYYLVKYFGDVPYIDYVLDTDSPELYGPRTPRNEVMDNVVADLNYAIENLSLQSNKGAFCKDLASAIKTEVCLFEGTFAKYIEGDNSRAQQYLQMAVAAGEEIAGRYPIGSSIDSYWAIYNTLNTGLNSNSEIIWCRTYSQGLAMHSTIDYTNATDGVGGMTKDAFDSFLFLDGKPLASTSYDTNDKGKLVDYKDAAGNDINSGVTINISDLLAVRDQRLSMCIYDYVFWTGTTWNAPNANGLASSTGYGIKKYNNFSIAQADAQVANKNYTSCPLYWGAKLYVEIAEAKAELGTLTDQDVATYLNPLYARAGLPAQTVSSLSSINDPANNMGVSSLIWEVRRCRRCELMYDGFRFFDLIRWKQLDKMDQNQYPNTRIGANISAWLEEGNDYRNDNGYILSWPDVRNFNNTPASGSPWGLPREYFYPIPTGQIDLNPALTQNPGWAS